MVSSHRRFLTSAAQDGLRRLGGNISISRKRRRMSQEDVASRAGIGVATLRRLEKGESVSLDILANVLVALNLEDTLLSVADPQSDEVGLALERRNTPKRIRKRESDELDTNF
ncbi:MAG: helix-turn-helix domain-containing protein [Saccharospirillum sp.]|nr:helix-turn-helix domain-containing protein [Saccharospirillum sp.]